MINPITFFKNRKYRDAEMVSYWKTQDAVQAKLVRAPEGHHYMVMQGEKYPFMGHPRGALLFGGLSPLKHEIKNQIFNHIWARLEAKDDPVDIVHELKTQTLPKIMQLGEKSKYDMVPFENLMPSVKEIHRAMMEVGQGDARIAAMREIFCFIMQEDDGYRMRLQWVAKFFPKWWKPTLGHLEYALTMLEHAEIVGDMKERQRLLKRVLLFIMGDPAIKRFTEELLKEIDWSKVRLTKGDKYFLRAKYFKCDYPEYKY